MRHGRTHVLHRPPGQSAEVERQSLQHIDSRARTTTGGRRHLKITAPIKAERNRKSRLTVRRAFRPGRLDGLHRRFEPGALRPRHLHARGNSQSVRGIGRACRSGGMHRARAAPPRGPCSICFGTLVTEIAIGEAHAETDPRNEPDRARLSRLKQGSNGNPFSEAHTLRPRTCSVLPAGAHGGPDRSPRTGQSRRPPCHRGYGLRRGYRRHR